MLNNFSRRMSLRDLFLFMYLHSIINESINNIQFGKKVHPFMLFLGIIISPPKQVLSIFFFFSPFNTITGNKINTCLIILPKLSNARIFFLIHEISIRDF